MADTTPTPDSYRARIAAAIHGEAEAHSCLHQEGIDEASIVAAVLAAQGDEAPAATPPVYRDVVMTRTLGRGVTIDTAPEHTRMGIAVLVNSSSAYVHISEVSPGRLLVADQVEYLITGYDTEAAALTLRLVNDYRPGSAAADADPLLPRREPGAAWADVETRWPDETDTAEADIDRMMAAGVPVQIVAAPTAASDPHTGLVVHQYRHDRGHKAWSFRCWGDDTYNCDGWLSLDHYSEDAAVRSRDRHVAEKHVTPAATEG